MPPPASNEPRSTRRALRRSASASIQAWPIVVPLNLERSSSSDAMESSRAGSAGPRRPCVGATGECAENKGQASVHASQPYNRLPHAASTAGGRSCARLAQFWMQRCRSKCSPSRASVGQASTQARQSPQVAPGSRSGLSAGRPGESSASPQAACGIMSKPSTTPGPAPGTRRSPERPMRPRPAASAMARSGSPELTRRRQDLRLPGSRPAATRSDRAIPAIASRRSRSSPYQFARAKRAMAAWGCPSSRGKGGGGPSSKARAAATRAPEPIKPYFSWASGGSVSRKGFRAERVAIA